jgi:3-methylfumaryl-CoA hydratase
MINEPHVCLQANDPQPLVRDETCTVSTARRVAAMLDLDPAPFTNGQALPLGWHFVMLGADTRRSDLRADGFPGLGVPMPDLGLPRLMLGSRAVAFGNELPIGALVTRTSALRSVTRKTTAAGEMAFVLLEHRLVTAGQLQADVVETQTYLLLPPRTAPLQPAPAMQTAPVQADHFKTVVVDETLLFQYSALGFNSHRIHLDRQHAREVEGFPDLVVNGGLATLLLTEFLRLELGIRPRAFSARHVTPLYCDRPITLTASKTGAKWRLQALDDAQCVAVDMEVEVQ